MHFQSIDLIAFGAFTKKTLQFADQPQAIQLIYGENEAGKSSTLRAILGLLFGIPRQTSDAHKHKMSALRVGAKLQMTNGQQLEFVRRKGRKQTLLGKDNSKLPDSKLQNLLAGIDQQFFESMFAMSHESLQHGGETLLQGDAKLGESLFGSSLGESDIPNLLRQLETKSDQLYSRRARKKPLNQSLSDYRKLRGEVRELSLKPAQWHKLQKQINERKLHQAQCVKQETQSYTHKRKIERQLNILPRLAQRRALLAALKELPTPPEKYAKIPENCFAKRSELENNSQQAEFSCDKTKQLIQNLQERLQKLTADPRILDKSAIIQDLTRNLGSYQKAEKERPNVQAKAETLEARMREILAALGIQRALTDLQALQLSIPEERAIRTLIQQKRELEQQSSSLKENIQNITTQLANQAPPIQLQLSEEQTEWLQTWLNKAQAMSQSFEKLQQLNQTHSTQHNQLEQQLQRLPIKVTQVEALPQKPKIDIDAIRELVETYRATMQQLQDSKATKESSRKELEQANYEIDHIELHGHVVTEEELELARQNRDAILTQLKSTPQVTQDDWHIFEKSLIESDALADRLWHEAERVTGLINLRAKKRDLQRKLERYEEHCQELKASLKSLEKNFQTSTGDLFIYHALENFKLEALFHWIQALEDDRALLNMKEQSQSYEAEITSFLDKLSQRHPHLVLGICVSDYTESLRLAESFFHEQTQKRSLLADQQQTRHELEQQKQAFQTELLEVNSRLADFTKSWQEATAKLGTNLPADPEGTEMILSLHSELFQLQHQRLELRKRLEELNLEMTTLDQQVANLTQNLQLEGQLEGQTTPQRLEQFARMLETAKTEAALKVDLQNQIEEKQLELDDSKLTLKANQSSLLRFLQSLGANDPEELAELEQVAEKARQLSARLAQEETQLLQLLPGKTIPEIEAEMAKVDVNQLDKKLHEIERELTQFQQQRTELDREIGRLEKAQENQSGQDLAANKSVELEFVRSKCLNQLQEYMKVKFAETILRQQIEQYRQQHQGPVLSMASELFSKLTCQSFSSLAVDYDQNDEPHLVCLRPNTEKVEVSGLSTGSRDQLFLALRLASIQHYNNKHEAMPLICDDILVHFDDQRSEAALHCLASLINKMQVLFFTHHKRLVEIAESTLPPNQIKIHKLEA